MKGLRRRTEGKDRKGMKREEKETDVKVKDREEKGRGEVREERESEGNGRGENGREGKVGESEGKESEGMGTGAKRMEGNDSEGKGRRGGRGGWGRYTRGRGATRQMKAKYTDKHTNKQANERRRDGPKQMIPLSRRTKKGEGKYDTKTPQHKGGKRVQGIDKVEYRSKRKRERGYKERLKRRKIR